MKLTDADRAYRLIKEKIITVEMPPGSVIRETQLMAELGLGRTPIREALMQLETENLVEVVPRRGLFVTEISITDLQQIYEVRVEIESLCARLAAQRFTAEDLAEMRCLVAEYQAAEKSDKKWLLDQDRRLHSLLARATGNKFLYDEFEKLYNLSIRIWHLAFNRMQPEDVDVGAHLDILAAIEAGDCDRAEQRMREHIEHFHSTIRLYL
jgi:DNA-binding GntR family transcriptional regulator